MPPSPLTRLRKLCLALPEAHEVEAWGEPTFRVRNKLFAMYASPSSHHGEGRPAVWCKAAPGNQSLMVQLAPQRFFAPPYVGPSGWVGVWLDTVADWSELAELLRDAYRLTAPKRVAAQLDEPAAPTRARPKRAPKTAARVRSKRAVPEKAPRSRKRAASKRGGRGGGR